LFTKTKKWQLTGILLVGSEELDDLLTNLTIGHADIILGVTVVVHQREEAIVRDVELQSCVNNLLFLFFFLFFSHFLSWDQN
jgi:hypothetical protein